MADSWLDFVRNIKSSDVAVPTGFDMDALLDAVEQTESGGNPRAISPKGALGAYQFMPATAKQYGLRNPFNRDESREAARRYMTDLGEKYNYDLDKMLAGYNWGQGNVQRKGMSAMPEETRSYIAKVRGRMGEPTQLASSQGGWLGYINRIVQGA